MFHDADALLLARIQFGFTVSFHFIFPAFTIGLASYLAVLEGLWLKTGKSIYLDLYKYWLKIFAVTFAMGVVSGIVMAYQFGSNWAVFSDRAGPVIGPLMAYEVLTAFFLEAGLSRRDAVRHEAGGEGSAFLRHAHGGDRHHASRRSGFSASTAGCRRPPGTPSTRRGNTCPRPAGCPSFSIRAFRIAWCTP